MSDDKKLQTAIHLIQSGKLDKAVPLFKDLALRNKSVAIHQYNYGNALRMAGRLREASQFYALSHKLDPHHTDTCVNLGLTYCELGRLSDALSVAKTVLIRHPAHPIAALILNLAVELGARDENSLSLLRQVADVLETAPRSADPNDAARVTYALGIIQILLGRAGDGIATLRQVASHPHFAPHVTARLFQQQAKLCLWQDWSALSRAYADLAATQPIIAAPFDALKLDQPALHLRCAQAKAPKPPAMPFKPGPPRGGKLRIGYLSPDFNDHPTSFLMAELPELHDRSQFEVMLFSYGPDDGRPMRRRLKASADRFFDLDGHSSHDIAQAIHGARVDILVDLAPFIGQGRLDIAALRPAPVQVNWMGYPGTTGAPYMDYIVADDFIIPDHAKDFYSEAVVRLPVCYQSNDRKRHADTPLSRDAHGLPAQGRVLAAFHQSWKIQPPLFDIWCTLLTRHDDAVLWFVALDGDTRDTLRQEAEKRGIVPNRLIFGDRLPNAQHLARYAHADLLLDAFPCGAHTTLSDALSQGCPSVTLAGQGFASRVGGSLLRAAGLSHLITTSEAEYAALVDRLLTDRAALPALRETLRSTRDHMALFDTPRFVRELESAYRIMADRSRRGLPPQDFDIPLGGLIRPLHRG